MLQAARCKLRIESCTIYLRVVTHTEDVVGVALEAGLYVPVAMPQRDERNISRKRAAKKPVDSPSPIRTALSSPTSTVPLAQSH
jgi:hypothetical protein